jgi:3-oxoadipate enol-lactonase
MGMIFKSFDNNAIFYEVFGYNNTKPIILLHGIGADHKMFCLQVEELTKNGFWVVTPDLRGHGNSAKVTNLELEDWARDIEGLLTHLNITKAVFLGVSMGGVICLDFACRYPERVAQLIISDSFAEVKTVLERFIGQAQVSGFQLFHYLPPSWAANLVSSTYKELSRQAEAYFKEITLKSDFGQLALARRAINKINVLEKLNSLNIPALVIVGDKVKFMIPINQKIAENFKQAEFEIIENAMDPSNLVKPEQFNRLLINFLRKHN